MNEVSSQATAMVLDALDQRGIDMQRVWAGLNLTRDQLTRRGARIDWATWLAMLERVQREVPVPLEEMFVPGAGQRTGHPLPRMANVLLSQRDMYRLIARWGYRQSFTCTRARLETTSSSGLRLHVSVDPGYPGSLAFHRFTVGVMREVPRLQGYGPARVRLTEDSTPERATFDIVLPRERSIVSRATRFVRTMSGAIATLEELERQADEIAHNNAELERELARSRERDRWLEVALDAGNIGLWRWDPSTRRVRISGALAEWLQVPGQTDIDTTVWGRLVHPDDQAKIAQAMTQALEKRTPFEAEYRIERDGDVRWFHIKGRVEVETDGRVYVYGSTVDVTDAKLIESRLRMADRLIAAGTLAAGVAHEINNPLTYVMGSIDLIRRRLASHPAAREATQELVSQALDGVERIRGVVADVRAFARHDDQAIGRVDLASVVASAMRIVGADVRHRAEIRTVLDPETPAALANDARLVQVLINLLVNAHQAMPATREPGENVITVRTRRLDEDHVALEVEDNGLGIRPDIVARVFDPFFTTKPVGVGTGLGLSVCQGIVTSLGGRIDLETSLGRGTKFTVALVAAPSLTASEPAATTASASLPGNRVLVIDDEPLIRSVVVRTLAAQGFEVEEVESGRAGLERAIGPGRYDAILCDLMMPDVDGVTIHGELVARRPDLVSRVVFISGGAVSERVQELLARPGIVVLHKPFGSDQLVEAIERAAAEGQGTSTSLPLT